MIRPKSSLAVAVAVVMATGCAARRPGEPIEPGFNIYSQQQDIDLGRQAAAEIRQQVHIVENRQLQEYVDALGRKLATTPAAGDYPYDFTLINDKSINAFALPGGPIFINSGLIAAASNEAQVAGVLAHEIAHIALRHATSQASKANLLQLPAMIAGSVLGQGSAGAQLGQAGLGLGLNLLMLRYSRGAETEADALGAKMMAQAGYNPLEMARFFETLKAEGGARAPEFLSSHPDPGNRVSAVEAEVAAIGKTSYNAGTGDFSRARDLVAALPPSKAPARAAAAATPQFTASAEQRSFNGARFAIAYPSNWQTYGDPKSSLVAIAPPEGLVRTANGNVAVGYGAILSYYFPRSRNLRDGTAELLARLRAGNPAMEVAGAARRIRAGGAPALLMRLTGSSPYGGQENNWLLTVSRPEGLFYMLLAAPQGASSQLEPALQRMISSIRFAG